MIALTAAGNTLGLLNLVLVRARFGNIFYTIGQFFAR